MSPNIKSVLLSMLLNEALHSCKSPLVVLRPTRPKRKNSRVDVKPKPSLPQIKNDLKSNANEPPGHRRSDVMANFGQPGCFWSDQQPTNQAGSVN